MLLLCATLAALYRHGGIRRSPKWRWVVPGALLATSLWLVGSSALSMYVQYGAQRDPAYGSLGAFLVLMLWCFVTAFAILLGAALNAELERQTAIDTTVGAALPVGERGAQVADSLGVCHPRFEQVVRDRVSQTHAAAKRQLEAARQQVERVQGGGPAEGDEPEG